MTDYDIHTELQAQHELLLKCFDDYENISSSKYFTLRYGVPYSEVNYSFHFEADAKNQTRLFALLGIEADDPRLVYRKWHKADHPEDAEEKDFPNAVLLAYHDAPICLKLDIHNSDYANLTLYYDLAAPGVEARAQSIVETVRSEYKRDKKSEFHILSVNHGNFSLESIEIKPLAVDIDRHYNDDFAPVNTTIRSSITDETSGLILLHGLPGTGKTSYIKSLVADFPDNKFIFIPNDFVQHILQPGFVTFLVRQQGAILIIEDAEKVIMSRQDTGGNSVVSTILQITDGLFSDYLNIKIICTFNNDVSRMDQALFRKGRMLAFYEFTELTRDKAKALLGVEEDKDLPISLTLAELYNREKADFSSRSGGKRIGFGA